MPRPEGRGRLSPLSGGIDWPSRPAWRAAPASAPRPRPQSQSRTDPTPTRPAAARTARICLSAARSTVGCDSASMNAWRSFKCCSRTWLRSLIASCTMALMRVFCSSVALTRLSTHSAAKSARSARCSGVIALVRLCPQQPRPCPPSGPPCAWDHTLKLVAASAPSSPPMARPPKNLRRRPLTGWELNFGCLRILLAHACLL